MIRLFLLLSWVMAFSWAEEFSFEALNSQKAAASIVAREFVVHGDPFRAVESLGKTQNLKQIGVAMASAGLMDKLIGPLPTDINPAASPSQLYSSFFKHELMKKCITTPLDVLILNKDLKDALVDSVKHAIVNAGANTLCYQIGQVYGAKKRDDAVTALDYALHKGSHAVVGFVSSAALGGNRNKHFGAGLGAMMAEIAAEALLPSAKELKAEKLALVDQEIARGNRDLGKIQERATHTMNQRYGKEMAIAKVIGTTAGALFFKRDGAEGAEQGAVRAVDYNTTGCLAALDYTDPSVVQYLESIDPQILAEIGFTIASLTPGGKLLKGGKQALQVGSKVVKKVISRVVPKKAVQKVTTETTKQVVKNAPKKAVQETKKLLPGEGKVGTYKELKSNNIAKKGDNVSAHHIPNKEYMKSRGVSQKDGISMNVQDPVPGTGGRHREIHKTLKKQDPNLQPREALAQAVKRTKEVYKKDGAYTQEIQEALKDVIKQNKETFPNLFNKK